MAREATPMRARAGPEGIVTEHARLIKHQNAQVQLERRVKMLMGLRFTVGRKAGTRPRTVMPTTAARITTGRTENLIRPHLVTQTTQVATSIRICLVLQHPSRHPGHTAQSTWAVQAQAGRPLGAASRPITPSSTPNPII